jgi:hypothetical protein
MSLIPARAIGEFRPGPLFGRNADAIEKEVTQFLFPVIVAVAPALEEYFRTHAPQSDRAEISFPIVYNRVAGAVDSYRKIPLFNNASVRVCLRRAEELLRAVSAENAPSEGSRKQLNRWT